MSAGGSSGSGDTRFSRTGTVNTGSWRNLSSDQYGLFSTGLGNVQDGSANKQIAPYALQRMNRVWDDVPYTDAACSVIKSNLPGNQLFGENSLQAQAGVNPYSTDYANNTYDRYSNEVLKMLGAARSGPMATRGGTAAQGYMQSDVVNQMALNREDVLTKNRQADSAIQQGASGQLMGQKSAMDQNAISGMQAGWGSYYNMLNDQHNAGELLTQRAKLFNDLVPSYVSLAAPMQGIEQNNLSGQGAQTSSSMGAGINLCCFIFLEAYDGVLPESVRKYRDMAAPESSARRKGYIRMSRWLVPAMRVNGFSRRLASHLLTKPLRAYGEWYYGNNKWGWVFWPLKQTWFKVWELMGKH